MAPVIILGSLGIAAAGYLPLRILRDRRSIAQSERYTHRMYKKARREQAIRDMVFGRRQKRITYRDPRDRTDG